jgi:hypothetical protein
MLLMKAEQVSEDGRAPPDYAWRSHASAAAPFKDRQQSRRLRSQARAL